MRDYDSWLFRGPGESPVFGRDDGDECGRFQEPDEDAPRNYRPRPCRGEIVDGYCDTCGESAGA